MERGTVSRRRLPALSEARRERLEAQIPLLLLAAESGLSLVLLSEYERGLRPLTPIQELARREAIGRLQC